MDFVTDTVDYSVAQFHDAFNHMLPVLAKVHQGFCGDILEDTFDKDQVIRIQAESRQKRVLVNVKHGRDGRKCFSMPLDYHAKFCVVSKRGKVGREARLEDIIHTEKLPVKIQFAKKEEITVGNTRTATIRFPEMELVKVFDEIYLLGNFMTAGIFSVPVVAIPLYLSQLRLAEIVGFKSQSPFEFQQYVQCLSDLAQPIKYDPTFGNKDIAEYRAESIQPDAEYSYIEPSTYSSIGTFFRAQPTYYEPLDLAAANEPGNVYDDITPHSHSGKLLDEMKTVQTRERPRMKADQPKPEQALPVAGKIGDNTQEYKPGIPKRIARNESDRADLRGASVVPKLPKSPPEKPLEIASKGPPTLPKRNITKPPVLTKDSTGVLKENDTIDMDSRYENMKIPRGRIHPTIQATVKSIETERKITVAQKVETSGEQVNVETNKGQPAITDGSNPIKGKSQLVPETIDVSQLTIAEVCDWMKRLKLEKYTELFQEQMIDGVILADLDATILKGDFGMTAIEALRLMKFARDGHVPK